MFEKVFEFFKTRKTTTEIQPDISIDYGLICVGDDVEAILRQQWEGLLVEIEQNPSIELIKRTWSSYGGRERYEQITLSIDSVRLKLRGVRYPDPAWTEPHREHRTETEQGNDTIDSLISQTAMVWGLTHCSERKYEAFIEFLKATRASRSVNK
jgi:hypothetical protein